MRKTLLFILSLVIAVGFGTAAFAMHGANEGFEYTPAMVKAPASAIDLSGSIRVRGDLKVNTDFNDDDGDSKSAFDERIRLKLEATVSPDTMGVIELENGADSYCGGVTFWSSYLEFDGECYGTDENHKDTYGWGSNHGATGNFLLGNAKVGDLRIRQAYISHQGTALTGVLSGFRIGHMLNKLGNGTFYNHSQFGDDGMIAWIQPNKNTELSLTFLKLEEGTSSESDDTNLWNLGAEVALDNANLGADLTYIDSQNAGYDGPDRSAPYDDGIHFWNLGLTADTEVQGIKLYGDLQLQGGAIEDSSSDDIDFEGYAWMVGGSADIPDSPVGVHAEVAYGSGQSLDDDVSAGDSIGEYLTSLSSGQKYTLVYEYTVASAASPGTTNTGLSNTWYVNLGADADVTPDINVSADYYYLQASEDIRNGELKETDDIGSEIDGKITYQIDTNLVYYIEGGILFAGDVYNSSSDEADNPYRIRNGMILSF